MVDKLPTSTGSQDFWTINSMGKILFVYDHDMIEPCGQAEESSQDDMFFFEIISRLAKKQKKHMVQEISNRTHWTDP